MYVDLGCWWWSYQWLNHLDRNVLSVDGLLIDDLPWGRSGNKDSLDRMNMLRADWRRVSLLHSFFLAPKLGRPLLQLALLRTVISMPALDKRKRLQVVIHTAWVIHPALGFLPGEGRSDWSVVLRHGVVTSGRGGVVGCLIFIEVGDCWGEGGALFGEVVRPLTVVVPAAHGNAVFERNYILTQVDV